MPIAAPVFADQALRDVALAAQAFRPAEGTFIVGVTGSVASGKSTLAAALAPALGTGEIVSSDGFLFPNAILDERGLTTRKGFPESYDLAGLAATLTGARLGPVSIPTYSHVTYDIDPLGARRIDRPGILIVEGLALGLDRPPAAGAALLIDCLIYIEAAEADLEAWFVARFMGFWEAAAGDPASFYVRFRNLDRVGAEALAHAVWTGINLPNLREHIAPLRALADVVVTKGSDHALSGVARPGA